MVSAFGWTLERSQGQDEAEGIPTINVDQMASAFGSSLAVDSIYDGEKFPGGFGLTELFDVDYWTLRKRSAQLFNSNMYARGLIRRLITNEINTGLTVEACPDVDIVGLGEDQLNVWTETVENRFSIWGADPDVCDWKQSKTFGAIQRAARAEALIGGDVLVVLRQNKLTKMPMVQLISGDKVVSPIFDDVTIKKGHEIKHGVELDSVGRVIAHWVRQDDGTIKRIRARGEKSGRKISWLVFGTDKRLDDVRGQPLLSIILQSLKEIDRYRDAVQRKAVINSILAMFIKKNKDKMGTLPMQGGAVRKGSAEVTDIDGSKRSFNIAKQIPGMVMEELQEGEEPHGFQAQGVDLNFGTFEAAVIQAIAWANEIPPEILMLAFSNNYSASQAAINEFKIYLNKVWSDWGQTFCQPIYIEWLISNTLIGKILSTGLLEAWRDKAAFDVFGAWVSSEWYGSIKPSTDMLKQTKGAEMLVKNGWSTNAAQSRGLTGTKFSKNIARLKQENQLKADAARPMLELKKEFGEKEADSAVSALDDTLTELIDVITDG